MIHYAASLDTKHIRQYTIDDSKPVKPQLEPQNRAYTGVVYLNVAGADADLDRLNNAAYGRVIR